MDFLNHQSLADNDTQRVLEQLRRDQEEQERMHRELTEQGRRSLNGCGKKH